MVSRHPAAPFDALPVLSYRFVPQIGRFDTPLVPGGPMPLRLLAALTVLLLGVSSSAIAQEARDLSARSARVTRGPGGGPVTGPSQAARPEIVSTFLAARHDARTLQSLRLERQNPTPAGVTHLTFGQQVAGLDVYGTYVKAAITERGEIVNVVENLAAVPPGLVPATETHRGALEAVLARYYPGVAADMAETDVLGETIRFARSARFSEEPAVTRVAVPMSNGALQTGYLVVTWDRDNILRHTVVGAGGRILVEELRTNTDSYRIFANHPGVSAQTTVSGPGAGNTESTIGWVFSNTTTGNNVDAYLDRDNNNAADSNGRPVSSTQDFLYTFSSTSAPTTTTNQMLAVTNLFYLNNVIHDKLYRHGFTESAGNFQEDNFGRGGAGSDSVNAEAQDGGGTNNANFATPNDGSNPRMQMYLWTFSSPNRDGDLDSDIVWHEYGHGLTWRMIGSMSGPLSGAIGEGMSDVLAIYINRNDRVGEYSYNNAGGIRRYPYTNYPLTYGDVTGSSVHNDGEIYAATMWKLLALWEAAGHSQDELFDHVVGGMNFTPAGPAYEDMRDGILASVPTQAQDCIVWQAFAEFGIGVGADGSISCRGPFCNASITESFTVPSVCSGGGGGNTAPAVTISAPASNSSFTEGTAIQFTGTASDTQDGNLTGGLVWTSNLDGTIGSGGSFTNSALSIGNHTITAAVTDSGGLPGSAAITVTITEPGGGGGDPTITLTATGYKVKGVKFADLSWSGATTANVDIYRDTTKITTANDGAYTDNTGQKGGGSFTYRVCEAGTTVCSPTVTIVF
jgi:extracellular elastinolytic metalloproteinase